MTAPTFKLWGTYYPPGDGLLAIFPSESEAREHASKHLASVVMFEFHGTAMSGPEHTIQQEAPAPRTLTWTGTDTSADLIRDAIVETEGKCETRIYRRLTDGYGRELTIDTPQRIFTIKRGESITRAAVGWVLGGPTAAYRPTEHDEDDAWSEYAQKNLSQHDPDAHRDFQAGWRAYQRASDGWVAGPDSLEGATQ